MRPVLLSLKISRLAPNDAWHAITNTLALLAFAVAIPSCAETGDNSSPCTVGTPKSVTCDDAQHLAIRDTPTLLVGPLALLRYYDRLSRARQLEPLLGAKPIDEFLYGGIESLDPLIGNAWRAMVQITKNVRGFSELDNHDGTFTYAVTFAVDSVYSPTILSSLLDQSTTWIPRGLFGGNATDLRLHWNVGVAIGTDDATATIDSSIAVDANCLSDCPKHFLRAVVSPTEAHVYDLGGEPLPPELQLRPTTVPWR
jgi:hypothetical protein